MQPTLQHKQEEFLRMRTRCSFYTEVNKSITVFYLANDSEVFSSAGRPRHVPEMQCLQMKEFTNVVNSALLIFKPTAQ